MRVVTGREMRQIDQKAIREYNIAGLTLMEKAGAEVAKAAQRILDGGKNREVVVIAGKGNNGGDGCVAARLLNEAGVPVKLFLLCEPQQLTDEAKIACDRARKTVKTEVLNQRNVASLSKVLEKAFLIIDAIFGTGFSGRADEFVERIIKQINCSAASVLSIDIPSGVEADTGKVVGEAVKANETITFGLPKLGQLIYPGAEFAGRLSIVNIGFPTKLLEEEGKLYLSTQSEMARLLPRRKEDTHKKACGCVFVLAGSLGLTGAAVLTAKAALRVGAGLVTVGIPQSLNSILEVKLTEEMTLPLPETNGKTLDFRAYDKIMENLADFDVVVIGPGLSRHKSTIKLVQKLIKEVKLPLVLDADGLNALEEMITPLVERESPTVITPHPGELGRLFKTTASVIQKDRIKWVRKAACDWQVVTILKGARTLVAEPGGKVFINSTGNAGMATAGTGDVLTGIISGLLAQGLSPFNAATLGVFLQGLAGDIAAEEKTLLSLIASDLINFLPKALKALGGEYKTKTLSL